MSGNAKKNKAPKASEPVDDDIPFEDTKEQFEETPVVVETAPKSKDKQSDVKKKSSKRGFKLSSIDPIILASFTVFLVACLIVTGVTVYGIVSGDSDEEKAEYGDKVEVNYVGSFFTYYDETGAMIFDTSMSNIADSSDYKKSYEFKTKESYEPLEFTIGSGDLLNKFESAVVGLKPGETTKVYIDDGYGTLTDNVNKFTVDKVSDLDNIKRVQVMSVDNYKSLFNTTDVPENGIPMVKKSPYGWDANIFLNTDGTITVENNPTGTSYTVDGVTIKDIVDDGTDISFSYDIENFEYNTKMFRTAYKDQAVYIIGSEDGKMTYKTTNEKTGIRLYFVIEFVGYSE